MRSWWSYSKQYRVAARGALFHESGFPLGASYKIVGGWNVVENVLEKVCDVEATVVSIRGRFYLYQNYFCLMSKFVFSLFFIPKRVGFELGKDLVLWVELEHLWKNLTG